eukprot:CAMPEP_0116844528 /NCGR_PEP_ID=MMETSP0418-20121206/12745_1 /TAXON_ID=1158023 /ORGANISM="Astrosyne radiata, Strain 13vi08-1A" /LENGTH=265 /DNA_ID=CAMNT_0004475505 /DNA_START=57 /DNA_END=854 /DNA_ORIENTATION=-
MHTTCLRLLFLLSSLLVSTWGYLAPSFVPKQANAVSALAVPKSVRSLHQAQMQQSQQRPYKISMMPIGVPKVAYRVQGTGNAEWIDIYNRLYRERIVFLGSEIDDELANQIIGVMLYLDKEDPSKPIYLYINCPGGSVIAGLAIFDAMQHIRCEVVTINLGLAASMASFLLAAGSKGKRLALPSSRVMVHQPMGGAEGQAEDIKVEAAQILRIRDNIVKNYAMFCGRNVEQVYKDLDRDNFMSAEEALKFGIIDRVIEIKENTQL